MRKYTEKRKTASLGDKIFDIIVYSSLTIIALIMIYPVLNVFAISLSPYKDTLLHPFMFFPRHLDFSAFKAVFTNNLIFSGYKNTLFVTIGGTILSVCMLILTAYPLSRKELRWKKGFMTYFLIVMVFSGGFVPEFIVMKSLGLYNSLWALIIPFLCPIYNLILMKSFFESIPESLIESAKIDGAQEWHILFRIIVPLSKPVIAAVSMFQAILFWNDFFKAVIYLKDQAKWPLQLILREIIAAADASFMNSGGNMAEINMNLIPAKSLQYASLIVVILPILCVYPFVQKYFVKGVMIGSVKG